MQHLKQTTSDNCGPTCIAMITGDMIPPASEIKIYSRGTYTFQLATYLQRVRPGLELILSYFNPRLTRVEDQHTMTKDDLRYRMTSYFDPTNQDEKMAVNYAISYLRRRNNDVRVAIPTERYIDSFLGDGFDALCLTSSDYYYDDEFNPDHMRINHHFVIIKHHPTLPDTHFLLLDPLCDHPRDMLKETFIYGLYASVEDWDIDSGTILFFR